MAHTTMIPPPIPVSLELEEVVYDHTRWANVYKCELQTLIHAHQGELRSIARNRALAILMRKW